MFSKKLYIVDFNGAVTKKIVEQFYKDMEYVKKRYRKGEGIIVRMSCPGGSPALSEEVMRYLMQYNKEKHILFYIEEMAASGGYYIASGMDFIYANKNAIVGSIGVIMQKYEISGLAEKIGVKEDNLSVGEFKQPLSLFKPVDKEGEKYLKENLMVPMYNNFTNTVAENRNIILPLLKEKYGEGRIFIASEVKGSLVDEIVDMTFLINVKFKGLKEEYVNTKKKTFAQKLGFNTNLKFGLLENKVSFL